MSKQIRFFAFDFAAPAHLSSGLWRHPEDRGSEYKSVKYWVEYAKLLESACFDGIFFANNDGYHDKYKGSVDAALRDVAQIPADEPAYVISAMAAATQYLGFGVTSSTAYDQPYNLARKFATLDHLTDGRVAWNLVTSYSDSAARNLGNGTQREHDDRYGHAEEFIDVALKLWEGSWEENAVVMDRENCTYIEPSRVHEIQHEGEHFKVPGIFACEPSAQRTPVIFQAGGSPRGVAFAAATAEAVFLNASTKEALKKQVDNLREQATAAGRNPDHIATVQMITVIAGRTDEEAQQRYEDYKKLVSYEGAMARYSGWLNLDMSEYDPDVPLKDVKTNASQTMLNFFLKMDPSKEWTPRDIAEYNGIGGTSPVIVGGPEKVADELQAWVEETGVSGFNVTYGIKYQDIKNFIDFAVPELQKRGAMRTEYDGPTLRENLFGKGQARLAGDHPGVKYRRNTSV